MNTPKGLSVLDQWEKASRKGLNEMSMLSDVDRPNNCIAMESLDKRILALIHLVRKKDTALSFALCTIRSGETIGEDNPIASALALTEELK